MSLFNLTKQFQPAADAAPAFNPADFVQIIDNPYFTLQPGTTFTSASRDGESSNNFVVTRETKEILGVICIVVADTAFEDGEVVERTRDYFAQDKEGNVWYFGEDTKEIENGHVVSTAGSWLAGVNGALPGIVMEADPRVGDRYDQEDAPGIAEDEAEVLALNATVHSSYGIFHGALRTADFTPLEPDLLEHKFYVKGVGQVLTLDRNTGEIEELVAIEVEGTANGDTLFGYAGDDEISGKGGDDDLDGRAGRDTIFGGFGRDHIDGGDDRVADLLDGGEGDDRTRVDIHDRAFGGAGNDLFLLANNRGFGSIDGGRQVATDLTLNHGDILQFNNNFDLTKPAGDRVAGIETLSMVDGTGSDGVRLAVQDVLDLGTGTFNPRLLGTDNLGEDDAVRIDGDAGDRLTLTGGNWSQIAASNTPADYNLFSATASSGHAYVLVQEEVTVILA